MDLEVIGGAVNLETLIGELVKAILDERKKAAEFQAIFDRLRSRLISIAPTIQEIEKINRELGRSKGTEELVQKLKEGKELIPKCAKVSWWQYHKKWKYSDKLLALDESLRDFIQVNMAVQGFEEYGEIIWAERSRLLYHLKLGQSKEPDLNFHPVGLDTHLEKLKKMLFRDGTGVIVVSAPGGCGKTTLAELLCRDDQVKGKFGNNIFFVSVSKAFKLSVIVRKLFQSIGRGVPIFQNDKDAVDLLRQLLDNLAPAPILLVLDDVWSGSEYILDKFVFKNRPGYKVLVTSRYEFPSFGANYYLPVLEHEDAMTLFRRSAFPPDGSYYMPDEGLVETIVKRCKGFPLALTTVGKSLCGQPAEAWEIRLRNWSEGQSISSSSSDILVCLRSSLNALDEEGILKQCFLDLGSFPEGQKIPAPALIDIWAELYKLHVDGIFAINSLQELSFRNLLNLVDERQDASDVDGCYNDTYVRQHGLLRELTVCQSNQGPVEQRKRLIVDLVGNPAPSWWTEDKQEPFAARLLSISTDEQFFPSWCTIQTPEAEVLVLNFQSNESYTLPEFMKGMQKLKVLILTNDGLDPAQPINFSVLCALPSLKRVRFEKVRIPPLGQTTAEFKNLEKISLVMCKVGDTFGDCSIHISNMFPKLGELDIDHCNELVELAEGLCDLKELRKLSISNCPALSALPKGIGKLANLEVLRLRNCGTLLELPDSMGRLQKLSVLDISGCWRIKEMPEHMGKLCNLRKLHMRNCLSLCKSKLPASVKNLAGLKKVICDTETAELWKPVEHHLKNLKLSVHEVNPNFNWLI